MNYKESNVTESTWVRARIVRIDNPLHGDKGISFFEEEARQLPDGTVMSRDLGELRRSFDNAAAKFALIDPDTGAVTGQATFNDVYVILASLYMHLALMRDGVPLPE